MIPEVSCVPGGPCRPLLAQPMLCRGTPFQTDCTQSLTSSDGDGRISSDATFVSTMII